MSQAITAIYEDGVRRPLTPLELPDHTAVRITLEPVAEHPAAEAHRSEVDEALVVAGLMVPRPRGSAALRPLTDAGRETLCRHIPAGRPLSEIILEERDGR